MRVLLDTNVMVDVLQRREPWFEDGQKIFYAIANKQIIGCITTKEAADIHFFSRKQFTGQENVDEKARQVMTKLYAIFELVDTLGIDCQTAIAIKNNDYEDCNTRRLHSQPRRLVVGRTENNGRTDGL